MPGRICGRTLSPLAAIALCCGAAWPSAAGQGPASGGVQRVVPVNGARTQRLVVADPGAKESRAWPVVQARGAKVDRSGEGGMTLTSRVIVRTANLTGLRASAAAGRAAAPRVEPMSGVPGFAIVEADSVGEAIELAGRLRGIGAYESVELDVEAPRALRAPAEPNLANGTIWHLRNTVTPIADINADAAWDMGYTGAGVVMGIVEGGFQQNHPDLTANFLSEASQPAGTSSHATSCAGIAAAVGNGFGAVGLAYNGQISEQLYGASTTTAVALGYRNDIVDVKSNSWGPSDNATVSFMSGPERAALQNAVELGRGGLGTIICWAAGNGGINDRVDYDAYASSRFVFSIGAVGEFDTEAIYNESGSAMLVVTHSDGDWTGGQRGTYTTTTTSSYTSGFGGTSSASPLGMGAVALALEANPALTWRDVKHLLVETARKCDPGDPTWTVNAAGRDVSYKFGFGAIDAGALCAAAEAWQNVGPEVSSLSGVVGVNAAIPDDNPAGLTRTWECPDDLSIEAVELVFTSDHPYVGDLEIEITSPGGTVSLVADNRLFDGGSDYEDGYLFTSHRPFGESSMGTWSVSVRDREADDQGVWQSFEVRVYGTANAQPCQGDCDANGSVNVDDVECFTTAFLGSLPASDCDGNGLSNIDDVECFISAFLAGCP